MSGSVSMFPKGVSGQGSPSLSVGVPQAAWLGPGSLTGVTKEYMEDIHTEKLALGG